jgi:DNA modification methylase
MQEKVNKIYNGSNIDVLKGFQDNSCDALITDFPYGLSDVDPLKMIKEDVNNKASG